MKTLRLETTAPFQELAELVADDEGLFEAEDITIEWVARDHTPPKTDIAVTSPDGLSAYASRGSTFDRGVRGAGRTTRF